MRRNIKTECYHLLFGRVFVVFLPQTDREDEASATTFFIDTDIYPSI
jgi:hypothetical protein